MANSDKRNLIQLTLSFSITANAVEFQFLLVKILLEINNVLI